MAGDYIRREDALKGVELFHCGWAEIEAVQVDYIGRLPAADVAEVVQGSGKARATEEAETTQIIDGCCTACGEFMDCCEAADYKFCPYCAKRIV